MARIPLPQSLATPDANLPAPFANAPAIAKGMAGPGAGSIPGVSVPQQGPGTMGRSQGFMRDAGAETAAIRAKGAAFGTMANAIAEPLARIAIKTAEARNDADVMVADSAARKLFSDFRAELSRNDHGPDPKNYAELWKDRLQTFSKSIEEDANLAPVAKEKIKQNLLAFGAKSHESLQLFSIRREAALAKAKTLSAADSDLDLGDVNGALGKIAALKANKTISDAEANRLALRVAKVAELRQWQGRIAEDPVGALADLNALDEKAVLGGNNPLKPNLDDGSGTYLSPEERAKLTDQAETKTAKKKKADAEAAAKAKASESWWGRLFGGADAGKTLLSPTERGKLSTQAQASLAKAQAEGAKAIVANLPKIETDEELEAQLAAVPLPEADRQAIRDRHAGKLPSDADTNRTVLELAAAAEKLSQSNDPDGTKANTIRRRAAIEAPAAVGWIDRILPKAREETLSEDQLFRMGRAYIEGHALKTDPRPTAESDRDRLFKLESLDAYLERRQKAGKPANREDVVTFLEKDLGVSTTDPLVPLPSDTNPARVRPLSQEQRNAARMLADSLGIKPEVSDFATRHGLQDSFVLHSSRWGRLAGAVNTKLDEALGKGDDAGVQRLISVTKGMGDDFRLDFYNRLYRAEMVKAGTQPGGIDSADIDAHVAAVLAQTDTTDPAKVHQAIREAATFQARQIKRDLTADIARAASLNPAGAASISEWMAGLSQDPTLKGKTRPAIRAKPIGQPDPLMQDPEIKAAIEREVKRRLSEALKSLPLSNE